ncbi:MAG: hypothetical protein ACP5I8_12715 [Phycisphaerae bacterium]
MILSRESILAMADLPTKDIEVPEWGGTIRVKTLSAGEREQWETSCLGEKGKPRQIRASLAVVACVSDDGKPLFTQADIDTLGAKSGKALDRIFDAACELNGIGRRDVDELAKN